MYRHAEGLEFRFDGGMTAAGISDRTACALFGAAIDYADRAGDYRLSSRGTSAETGQLQDHSRVFARALAGFAITSAESSGLPLAIRVEDALDYGGLCVRADEILVLGDMVEWLDRRANIGGLRLESGHRASRVQPVILQVLRREESHFALNDAVGPVIALDRHQS